MLLAFGAVLVLVNLCRGDVQDWDIAVVVKNRLKLLSANGTIVGSSPESFTDLKALSYDNVRRQFIVSDMDSDFGNDSIHYVNFAERGKAQVSPAIYDLPDDVQGIVLDPINDILYWTDSRNKTINYASLNTSDRTVEKFHNLITFDKESPLAIALDICRRFIYWTNVDLRRPSIERCNPNGLERKIIIEEDLGVPMGITIDLYSDRLFWIDARVGIYYRIESSNLDGHDRRIIHDGTHTTPFSIAVNRFNVYWTDTSDNAIWSVSKDGEVEAPYKIQEFLDRPKGILARTVPITSKEACYRMRESVKEQPIHSTTFQPIGTTTTNSKEQGLTCLNGGVLVYGRCRCRKGFQGDQCELAPCENYCLHGTCTLRSGSPVCRCDSGFDGERCTNDLCDGFCIEQGLCAEHSHSECSSNDVLLGVACRVHANICDTCAMRRTNSNSSYTFCRNEDGSLLAVRKNLALVSLEGSSAESTILDRFSDPWFLGLATWSCICSVLLICTVIYILSRRRGEKRPRIKKRIIVNKNVQPLTYRPQTTEQCEITIENCCNMNVCETPCFEPKGYKRDDKKTLLANMENGNEDTY